MKDKIAFITGAAKGIGRATSLALSASGCQVILTDIDQKRLMDLFEGTGCEKLLMKKN